eukprot:3246364-Karenia_brevis.AAC.1
MQVAKLLAAWDAAKLHVSKEELAKVDARASQAERSAPTLEHTFMRTSFEKIHGRLLLDETPLKQYVGLEMVDIEEDEP